MQPTALHIRDLRSFAGHHRIELRPLTLIYGRNNVGKSVLVRSLPLLADTLLGNVPLALSSPAARGANFGSLQSKLQDAPQPIGLGLEWNNDEWNEGEYRQIEFEWDGDGPTEHRFVPIVNQWSCVDSQGKQWRATRKRTSQRASEYRFSRGDEELISVEASKLTSAISFAPRSKSPIVIGRYKSFLERWANSLTWLTADRRPDVSKPVQRVGYSHPLDSSGDNVLELLVNDFELQRHVSRFYEQLIGRGLEANELTGQGYYEFVLRLHRPKKPFLDVQLSNVGEGLIQILPVLTALAMADTSDDSHLLVVEEPESNQHGDLQEKLGRLIGDLAARRPDNHLVIETHSEVLLLTIQLMIAEGTLPPESVLMHWVRQTSEGETTVEPVTFDAEARPSGNLPRRPFSEDTDLMRRIHEARIARRKNAE